MGYGEIREREMGWAIGQVLPQVIGVTNALGHPLTGGWIFHLLATRVVVVAVLTLEALILNALTKTTNTPKTSRGMVREVG
jgi:hypothetical protein